jgi:hypothetical protein
MEPLPVVKKIIFAPGPDLARHAFQIVAWAVHKTKPGCSIRSPYSMT